MIDCAALAGQLAELQLTAVVVAILCVIGGGFVGITATSMWYERRYAHAIGCEREREKVLGRREEIHLSFGNGYPTEEVERAMESMGRESLGRSLPRGSAGAGVQDPTAGSQRPPRGAA